jgi:hypothetical protein
MFYPGLHLMQTFFYIFILRRAHNIKNCVITTALVALDSIGSFNPYNTGVCTTGVMQLLSWEPDCGNQSMVIALVWKKESAEVRGTPRRVSL